jgi:hypothetical protein
MRKIRRPVESEPTNDNAGSSFPAESRQPPDAISAPEGAVKPTNRRRRSEKRGVVEITIFDPETDEWVN